MDLTDARILVTGATGLFGSALVRDLARTADVWAMSRFSAPGSADRLKAYGARVIKADLGSLDRNALPDVDVVFHCGASLPTDGSERNPASTFATNVRGTETLLSAAAGAIGFFFCSSASVYADNGNQPLTTASRLGLHNGLEQYSASKIAGEQLVQLVSAEAGIPAVIARIFTLYGPDGGPITARIKDVLAGKPIAVYPDRAHRLMPIYIDDAVELAQSALDFAAVGGRVINFCGSQETTVFDYCHLAAELAHTPATFVEDTNAPYPLLPDPSSMFAYAGIARWWISDGVSAVVHTLRQA